MRTNSGSSGTDGTPSISISEKINLDETVSFTNTEGFDTYFGKLSKRTLLREALPLLKEVSKELTEELGDHTFKDKSRDLFIQYLEQLLNTK